MAMRDEALQANERYATGFKHGSLPMPPAKHLAAVVCMDARLMPDQFLGLGTGEAHIIRNAGGIVTDDALRSLIISHKLLGTNEFFVINHTDCGMLTFQDEQLQQKLKDETGQDASGIRFHAFKNLEDNVRAQVEKIKASPFLPDDIPVHGFVYQVEDGRLRQVA
ncbi:MAG: carbonic anhydrase [Dehalococcoidia bacterium]|nr:carbonic anhydrase [Dehalococcoidia bacterium]